jgi:serine protease AprX
MDGRFKPDLLAPGEKILSCAPGRVGVGPSSYSDYKHLDGTSIAAAHVAGAAAALLSVRRELIGKPEDVKQIFMQSATDLERTREQVCLILKRQ